MIYPRSHRWLRRVPAGGNLTWRDVVCADCAHPGRWRPENGTVEHPWGVCLVAAAAAPEHPKVAA